MINRPYRGSRYRRGSRVIGALLLVVVVLLLICLLGFVFLQDYIVFSQEGIEIILPFEEKPSERAVEDDPIGLIIEDQNREEDSGAVNPEGPRSSEFIQSNNIVYKYVSADKFSNAAYLDDICLDQTVNTVVLEVKSKDGKLHYTSELYPDIVSEYADSFSSAVKKFKAKDIRVIAQITSFKDDSRAKSHRQSAIKIDKSTIWLDYKNQRYLDPYEHTSWEYLKDIASEVLSAGIDELLFSEFLFPINGKTQLIYYVDRQISKEQTIKNALEYIKTEIPNVSIGISVNHELDETARNKIAGVDVKQLYLLCDRIFVSGDNYKIIEKNVGDSSKLVNKL